jgi:membrane-associated phospholipid phosphatase
VKSHFLLRGSFTSGLILTLALLSSNLGSAQSPAATPDPSPSPSPTPSLEKQFLRNVLDDQRAIWLSPFHLHRHDTTWLIPIGLGTAALISTDRNSADELAENGVDRTRLRVSKDISRVGATYTTAGIAATFYAVGRATNNTRARETGLLGAEALIDTGIVVSVLKGISQRPRPRTTGAQGDFFDGGNSFPSGHAISSWALATVIANEYKDRRAVQIAAYGMATAISLSRYTGQSHFLSDVLVGSALGYGIGRYVYRKHHVTASATSESVSQPKGLIGRLRPQIAPIYSGHERTYGVALRWP